MQSVIYWYCVSMERMLAGAGCIATANVILLYRVYCLVYRQYREGDTLLYGEAMAPREEKRDRSNGDNQALVREGEEAKGDWMAVSSLLPMTVLM